MLRFALALVMLSYFFSGASLATEDQKSAWTLVVIGDSITQGFGVEPEQAFPSLVEKKLLAEGKAIRVVNGGVSGSLSSSAANRVKWYLKQKPNLIFLELGGNDALKGTDVTQIKKNLGEAIKLAKAAQVPVLLAGMKIFSSFGNQYAQAFAQIYQDLAAQYKIDWIPFFMAGVAANPKMILADSVHPNALGHQKLAQSLLKKLKNYDIPRSTSAQKELSTQTRPTGSSQRN